MENKNCYEAVIRDTSCDEEDKTYFFKIRFKASNRNEVCDWLHKKYEDDPFCIINEVYAIKDIDVDQSALNGIKIIEL